MVVAKLEGEFFLSISHSLIHSLSRGPTMVSPSLSWVAPPNYLLLFYPTRKGGAKCTQAAKLSPPPPNGLSRPELEKKQIFFPGSEGNSARSWDSAWSVLIVSTVLS